MPGRVIDGSTVLREACAAAQDTFSTVAALEHAGDEAVPLTASPIHQFWLNESDSLLFYQLHKGACIVGGASGGGFLIARLPSANPSLIKWSAPCFVKISLASVGLSLGYASVRSFTACMSSAVRVLLYQQGRRHVSGLEAGLCCGGLQHKADLIAVPTTNVKTVGINAVRGALLDCSFSAGSLDVDAAKNGLVYGADATPLQILHGGIEPPREMQPLYAQLNAVVGSVERVAPPARVSASLERYTAGYDPDRHMVIASKAGGLIVQDEQRREGAGGEAAKDK